MSTFWHPFELPYVGLGLLDEASIRRDGDAWTADYRSADEPYLTIRVEPDHVEVVEVEVDGERVATTFERTLTRAIGLHGSGALRGPVSRFWQRAADLPGAFDAWVEVSIPRAQFAFVPAIGLGRLSIPWPTDVPWRTPEPGPIARRIGLSRSTSLMASSRRRCFGPTPAGRVSSPSRSGSTARRSRASSWARRSRRCTPRMVRSGRLPGARSSRTSRSARWPDRGRLQPGLTAKRGRRRRSDHRRHRGRSLRRPDAARLSSANEARSCATSRIDARAVPCAGRERGRVGRRGRRDARAGR